MDVPLKMSHAERVNYIYAFYLASFTKIGRVKTQGHTSPQVKITKISLVMIVEVIVDLA